MHLTRSAAQALLLAAQGLEDRKHQPTKTDVLNTIRRMGVLQIDTIHVVARSPYFVLWSRLGNYEAQWLDELLAEGALFEYWSHAACFLPIEDWPLYRRLMLDGTKGWQGAEAWFAQNPGVRETILERVRDEGPILSSNFERTDGQKGTWWNWKPEKMGLEALFYQGELMIARRHNFQRVYDLRERVLPNWRDEDAPTTAEVERILALRAVKALGVAPAAWVPDYYRMPKKGMVKLLERLADEGALIRVAVEGWSTPGYIHPDHCALAELAAAGNLLPRSTTLLSPFDPVVWDRTRARALFDFDYLIECYTPAAKRRYGYFTLPILHRGRLVGRLDPKAHRKEGIFEVKALHLEPEVAVTDELIHDLADALHECAAWHKTPEVIVRQSNPTAIATLLSRRIT
jgi:uncharacterized protein